jgi:YNFM family putative membrane transporter
MGHWQWVFWPMTVLSALSCYFIWRYLPASERFTPQPFRLKQALQNHAFHLNQPLLLLTYLIGGLNFLVFLNQYTFIGFALAAPPYLLSSGLLGMLFITYFTGTIGSALSSKISRRLSAPLAMAVGIMLMMAGTLVTLYSSLLQIVGGFFISAFGFFLCHSLASSWVNQHATRAKASASSLYLVFYYLGASIGGLYLQPFWQAMGWPGVVLASLLMYSVTLTLALWLWFRLR